MMHLGLLDITRKSGVSTAIEAAAAGWRFTTSATP
jgi:hypothetical protein